MEGDHLAKVRLTSGDQTIILATKLGMAICFNENDVRPMGRNTRGVRGITLADGDMVIGADVLAEDCQVLTVSEEGFGKRNNVDAIKSSFAAARESRTLRLLPRPVTSSASKSSTKDRN